MTLLTRGLVLVVFGAASAAAVADERPRWGLIGARVNGQTFLGSEDARRGGYYGIQYSRPDPRVHFAGEDGEFVLEGYYLFTRGGGFGAEPPDSSVAFGAMMMARYWPERWSRDRWAGYYEAGIGIQHQNQSTVDLNDRWNFTPTFGLGLEYTFEEVSVLLGIRYFHISNAGLRPPNQGQNQLLFLAGVRF